jgi:hypothetical protein
VGEIQASSGHHWKLLQDSHGVASFVESRDDTYPDSTLPFVCGDTQDLNPGDSEFLGNGILVQEDGDSGLRISSSLTGLPPLFLYEDDRCTILANSIDSIARLPCCSLHFDVQAVLELVKIGKPINHRTLFKEISIVPAGSLVTITDGAVQIKEEVWQPQEAAGFDSADDYLDAMVAAMQASIARMDLGRSFLSLTAGLDTRAILAALTMQDKLLPAFTISGPTPTLDAMRARQLSKMYGFPHTLVSIDHDIEDRLPEYTVRASRYSGGLNSIEQAIELYLYELAGPGYTGRVSGNLGNQVGRSGTEGTGIRNAPTTSLDSLIDEYQQAWDNRHWFYKANPDKDLISPYFIVHRENLFAQLGNFCIGHEFVTQRTPYADRTLIDMKYREPPSIREYPGSIRAIKRRDLKHRILGQSVRRSFQCRVVQKAGGFVANCPINWGWKVAGGYSPGGLYYGGKAFADIALGHRLDRVPGAVKVLQLSGIRGFSSFHTRHIVYTAGMQDFIRDLFHKTSVLECGLFKRQRLAELSDRGITDESLYDEVVVTLDLAMAAENFGASV